MKHKIASLQHPLVKHLVKLRKDQDYRQEQDSVVIEGVKLVQEVHSSIKKIIYVEKFYQPTEPFQEEWVVTEEIMNKISGMTSPEGVMAEVTRPPFSSLKNKKLLVALDGINDPGNMGTILRTALALGWEGVYILHNSCDPYNEKVLRAARGAHFRLPIRIGSEKELFELIEQNQLDPWAADLTGQKPEDISSKKGKMLILGNEAHGVSDSIKCHCSKVSITMPGDMESLNVAVAAGILMYELKKE